MQVTESVHRIDKIAVESFTPDNITYEAPLLFIHGSGGGSWLWDNFTKYFASHGWVCYALNLRGHHLSEHVEDWGEVGVTAYLDDIDKAVSWIGKDLILIGHSMGGVLAQKHAESRNPLKLILLHTSPASEVLKKIDFNAFLKRGKEKGRMLGEKVLQSDEDPIKMIGYMFDPDNVEKKALEMAHQKMGKESSRAILEMKDVLVDANKIRCPVYVLGFDLKKIGLNYSINLSEEMARYYRARDYQVIEPGGHMFMLEKNWEEFAKLIKKWLLA
jgi:pimeloyl-ACP methyl ester carboxylesterase